MAGCKRCALKGEKGKGKKKRKEKEKGGKKGIKIVFFISPCACFFSYAQWSFLKCIRKTVARLSRLYSLLFAIKMFIVSQFETCKNQICTPPLFWQLLQISLAVLRISKLKKTFHCTLH